MDDLLRGNIMNVVFTEKKLTCADCGQEFIFKEGEQRFFWSKGLAEPKRCKPCRMIRRRSIVSIEEERNDHNGTN